MTKTMFIAGAKIICMSRLCSGFRALAVTSISVVRADQERISNLVWHRSLFRSNFHGARLVQHALRDSEAKWSTGTVDS